MTREQWIKDVLVKQILDTYQPLKSSSLNEVEVEHIVGKKDNFASATYSIILHVMRRDDAGNEVNESHSIFAKFFVEVAAVRQDLQSDKQFHNEILWYSQVVPKFESLVNELGVDKKKFEVYPKCYYANYDDENAVVALEDLRPMKYHLGDRKCLEVRYVVKSLEALARSHALAYRWRHTDEKNFMMVANSFKETTINETMDPMLKITNERILTALEKKHEYADRVRRFRELTAEPHQLRMDLVKPVGPLATLCHGDFCRNNILFEDSTENGNPAINVMLIDFQTVRYASPAIDLSFFFFLSTTPEFRAAHFDHMFKLYHETLINELRSLYAKEKPELLEKMEEDFSFQAYKDDYANHAVYGYFIMSFFLPVMLIDDKEREEASSLWESGDPNYLEMSGKLGGEEVTSIMAESLKEMLDREYWPLGKK